jgi:hypothetical protein
MPQNDPRILALYNQVGRTARLEHDAPPVRFIHLQDQLDKKVSERKSRGQNHGRNKAHREGSRRNSQSRAS